MGTLLHSCEEVHEPIELLFGMVSGIGSGICILHGGPADATATPSSLASLKPRMVLPFWYWLTQIVLEKRPLNGCMFIALNSL